MKKLGNLPVQKRVNRSRLPIQNAKKLPKRPKNSVYDSISNKNPPKSDKNPKKTPLLKNLTTLSHPPGGQINKK